MLGFMTFERPKEKRYPKNWREAEIGADFKSLYPKIVPLPEGTNSRGMVERFQSLEWNLI